MHVWDVRSFKSIRLNVVDETWIVSTPDGRFDASEKGRNLINIVQGMMVLDSPKDWNRFYTPGLFTDFMGRYARKKPKDFLIGRIWRIDRPRKAVTVAVRRIKTLRPGSKLKVYVGKRTIYLTVKELFHTNVSCSVKSADAKRLKKYLLVYR